MGYEYDLNIDKYSLDLEWEKQAQLYMKWSERYAEAVRNRDRAKEKLELVRAAIDEDIRLNPEKYGFDKKPTESAISAMIIKSDKYIEANRVFIESTKEMNVLAGAKEAMAHKKKALESITQLWLGGYYAAP